MMTLGERIKAARTAIEGLTQVELAIRCGWGAATAPGARIGNYEQGTREPTLEDLRKIADAVKDGGRSYEWIVLGYEPSQLSRSDWETLADAADRVAKRDGAVTASALSIAYEHLRKMRSGTSATVTDLPAPKQPDVSKSDGADAAGSARTESNPRRKNGARKKRSS